MKHIFDRQLLRWVELRYEYMISLQDRDTHKKVKLLTKDIRDYREEKLGIYSSRNIAKSEVSIERKLLEETSPREDSSLYDLPEIE